MKYCYECGTALEPRQRGREGTVPYCPVCGVYRPDPGASAAAMCTCGDNACPNHPTCHSAGCTPCIAKNLRLGEIPSCFFNAACGRADQGSYFYRDFAKAVLESENP